MRFAATAVVSSALLVSSYSSFALHISDTVPSENALAALQAKAEQAPAQDQCYLYAELVQEMTVLAGSQLSAGDSTKASATLSLVRRYAARIHQELESNSKKLKNAALLMQHAGFRLENILGSASYEDRAPLQATLKDVNDVQTQLMMAVFRK